MYFFALLFPLLASGLLFTSHQGGQGGSSSSSSGYAGRPGASAEDHVSPSRGVPGDFYLDEQERADDVGGSDADDESGKCFNINLYRLSPTTSQDSYVSVSLHEQNK